MKKQSHKCALTRGASHDAAVGSAAQQKTTLYAAVGSGDIPERAVCEKPLALKSGDIFLLCSDGFWESINEDAMEAVLQQAASPLLWINDMVRQFSTPEAGDQDDFSALAIWVGDREEVTRIIVRHG